MGGARNPLRTALRRPGDVVGRRSRGAMPLRKGQPRLERRLDLRKPRLRCAKFGRGERREPLTSSDSALIASFAFIWPL